MLLKSDAAAGRGGGSVRMIRMLMASAVLGIGAGAAVVGEPAATGEVVGAYLADMAARDHDALGAHLADDVRFDDRMTTRWYPGGAQADDRAGLLALERSWGDSPWKLREPWSIERGDWVLTVTRLAGEDAQTGEMVESPFSTLLRVEGGVIAERHDWGDYSVTMPEAAVAAEGEARATVRGVRERVIAAIATGNAEAIRDEFDEGVRLDQAVVGGEVREDGGADGAVEALLAAGGVLGADGAVVRQAIESERCAWYVVSAGEGADERAAGISLLTSAGKVVEVRVYLLGG